MPRDHLGCPPRGQWAAHVSVRSSSDPGWKILDHPWSIDIDLDLSTKHYMRNHLWAILISKVPILKFVLFSPTELCTPQIPKQMFNCPTTKQSFAVAKSKKWNWEQKGDGKTFQIGCIVISTGPSKFNSDSSPHCTGEAGEIVRLVSMPGLAQEGSFEVAGWPEDLAPPISSWWSAWPGQTQQGSKPHPCRHLRGSI